MRRIRLTVAVSCTLSKAARVLATLLIDDDCTPGVQRLVKQLHGLNLGKQTLAADDLRKTIHQLANHPNSPISDERLSSLRKILESLELLFIQGISTIDLSDDDDKEEDMFFP
mmetsp:Transcript_3299/g.4575  ORF Transcript_3299/g.4575 Transcript_3299/m.4575 type:complete len:113 (-) Transcript_3299:164-502(-)